MIKWFLLATVFVGIQNAESIDSVTGPENIDGQLIKKELVTAKDVTGYPMKDEEVTFYLFKKGKSNYTQFCLDDPAKAANEQGRLYFIIHGWWESRLKEWIADLTAALLERDPKSQVVQVDWSGPAGFKNFSLSVYNTEDVGRVLAKLINKLVEHHNQHLKDVVVIGHSLGGQIAGFTGKKYKELTNKIRRLPRLIALDPAGLLFSSRSDDRRLYKEDGDNVVVIHTDGAVGFVDSCGTLDFFPNGGYSQTGCQSSPNALCSHWRSWGYFIEAVLDKSSFESVKCDDYASFTKGICKNNIKEAMGNALWSEKTGKFYFNTNSEKPYTLPS